MTSKTTRVDFYTAGLNATNWAYDFDALTGILNSSAIEGGSVELSAPLAFGASFYLSFEDYSKVKRATYIQIVNTYENESAIETRFAFLTDFTEMNNGKWRVDYSLDDWANYVLSPNYNVDIEGFTDRANVGLLANVYDLDELQEPYTGLKLEYPNEVSRTPHDSRKIYVDATLKNGLASLIKYDNVFENHNLKVGHTCAVYFVSEPRFDGNAVTTTLSGKLLDIDVESAEPVPRYLERKNSRIYFVVFDENGKSLPIYDSRSGSQGIKQPYGALTIDELEESNVDKIIYFPYFPGGANGSTDVGYRTINNVETYCMYIKSNALDFQYLSDVAHVGSVYQKGLLLQYFSPVMQVTGLDFLDDYGFFPNREPFEKQATYRDYFNASLYRQVSQAQSLKIKYGGAEITLPKSMLRRDSIIFIGLSGDAESVWIKTFNLRGQGNYNNLASVMQNQNFFDIALSTDYKAYKIAKITGTAQLIGGAVNTALGSAKSIATGGVMGAIGAGVQIAQSAVNLYAGFEKMNGLSPIQQGSANNDYTVVQITNLNDIVFEIERTLEPLESAEIRDFERNGIACSFEINEYLRTQRCQAYNAIKMAFVDIHGIPEAPALNIANALLSGITLWSSTEVGKKDVINYQVDLPNVFDGPLIEV